MAGTFLSIHSLCTLIKPIVKMEQPVVMKLKTLLCPQHSNQEMFLINQTAVWTEHMCRHWLGDGLIILPVCGCSITDEMRQPSVVRSAAALQCCHLPNTMAAFILLVYCKKKKKEGRLSTRASQNLMRLKPKGKESGLLSCTWTCAPEGMVLFASCILSEAPNLCFMCSEVIT